MRTTTVLTLFLLTVFSCKSNSNKNLTVEQIWEKFTNAYGNKEKINGIRSYKATLITSQNGNSYETEFYLKGKDKLVLVYKYPDNNVTYKLNGLEGIEISQNKKRILDDNEVLSLKTMCNLYSEIYFVNKGYKLELMGKELINENETYKVKVIDENNEVFFYYIDTKTFYDIKLESKNGASYFSDYKLIDGILCSFKSRFVQNDNELMIEKRDVQFNPSIEDSFFDLKN